MESEENSAVISETLKLKNALTLARNEINNLRQQVVSLKHSHKKDYDHIKQTLEFWTCGKCTSNDSNASSSTSLNPSSLSEEETTLPYKFIGHVETGFASKRAVPRQPGILSQSQGIIRIDNRVLTNPQHALEGLEQFSHMWILFYFHANDSNHTKAKVAPPRMNGTRMGVFATRSPHRPSPIGLSLVKINSVEDNCIFFSGVDMVDRTPVLDIKPFIPQYDSPYPTQLSRPPGRLHWHRMRRNSSNDRDLDIQERLLIGESSSSGDQMDGSVLSDSSPNSDVRVLDGRDSDEVFQHPQDMHSNLDHNQYLDRSSTISTSQREAPEGSEGPSSPTPPGNVRIANWITNPPVAQLSVQFADDCLSKLENLMGSQAAASNIQSTICSILSEDPRSVYVRERYSEDPYTCAILGLSITCFFDDTAHVCLITDVDKLTNILDEDDNSVQ